MSRIVLTDIEGTTSAIDFVHRVLFPYARQCLPDFVRDNLDSEEVRAAVDAVLNETGASDDEAAIATLLHWIDIDRKAPALKTLQGLIWREGYEQGRFTAHLYIDAYDQLRAWHARGVPLYVYSSGSVAAQKLFFRYSVFGNLLPWFAGHFDTAVGAKREPDAYRRIVTEIGTPGDVVDAIAEETGASVVELATHNLPDDGTYRTFMLDLANAVAAALAA